LGVRRRLQVLGFLALCSEPGDEKSRVDQKLLLGAALGAVAYLAGSLPFGLWIARARGIDIRTVGSGNIGATNVARSLGKKLGALVLLLDAGKGALPVAGALWLVAEGRLVDWAAAATGLAAVVGHCFPVWLRFRGGKGVATALGVFLVIDPLATLACVGVFAASYTLWRIASVGSLLGAAAMPLALWWRGAPGPVLGLTAAIVAVIFLRHRDNLTRLREGDEPPL
jgi:glycerol-3-phosphate acyltransferase PlsY